MNHKRLRQQNTVSGTFMGDFSIACFIGLLWYGILVLFFSF